MTLPDKCSDCKKAFKANTDGSYTRYSSDKGWCCQTCKRKLTKKQDAAIDKLQPVKKVI